MSVGVGSVLKSGASAARAGASSGWNAAKAWFSAAKGSYINEIFGASRMHGPLQPGKSFGAELGSYAYYKGSAMAGAAIGGVSGAIDGAFNSDSSVIGGAMRGAITGGMVGAAIPAAFHYASMGLSHGAGFASVKAVNSTGGMKAGYTDAANAMLSASNMISKYGNKPQVVQGSLALATLASTGVGARVLNRNKRA